MGDQCVYDEPDKTTVFMTEIIGHFHPLLVHLPIGFFLLGLIFYLFHQRGLQSISIQVVKISIFFSLLAALASACTGYFLADGGGYESTLVDQHRLAGISFAVLNGILLLAYYKELKQIWIRSLWFFGTFALLLTGHLGGSLTHGEDFLGFGTIDYVKPTITDPQQALVFTEVIEPIFAEKCWKCHSSSSKKGGLRLDEPTFIEQGGKDGIVLVPHQTQKSELFQRLLLPKDHDDHMPPDGRSQLSASEIDLIEWWISEGASFDKKVNEVKQSPKIITALAQLVKTPISPVPLPEVQLGAPDQNAIELLQKYGVTISKVDEQSSLLSMSMYAKVLDEQALEALNKISKHIVWFKAVDTELTAEIVKTISQFSNLFILELRTCKVSTSLSPMSQLQALETLNLSGTKVDPKDIEILIKIPSLKHLYFYGSGIDSRQFDEYSKKLTIDTGGYIVPSFATDTLVFKREELSQVAK